MIVAKKRFGQNFLTDPRKADKLVRSLEIEEGDIVLEIGAGTGILTERILDRGTELISVEIDRDLVAVLKERFAGSQLFRLVEDDIINVRLSEFGRERFKLIGNLPYNISGAVIEWLILNFNYVRLAVITVQKEVGDRLRARPGSRDYGSITVLAQSFFDISRAFNIPPGCFSPRPKVDSIVLRLEPNRKLPRRIPYDEFAGFVRKCFSQKRKKLANSLAGAGGIDKRAVEGMLMSLGKTPNSRAEELTLSEFYRLYGIAQ